MENVMNKVMALGSLTITAMSAWALVSVYL